MIETLIQLAKKCLKKMLLKNELNEIKTLKCLKTRVKDEILTD